MDHDGEVVTSKHLAEIFDLVFIKVATIIMAVNGFQKTGIYPFDQDVFCDADFMAAETTNLQIESISSQVVGSNRIIDPTEVVDSVG